MERNVVGRLNNDVSVIGMNRRYLGSRLQPLHHYICPFIM